LLINVLKKEAVFAKGIPIIKVCVAVGDVEPAIVRSSREKGKPGGRDLRRRKRTNNSSRRVKMSREMSDR